MHKKWNRSSAQTPEVLAAMNGAISFAVGNALKYFNATEVAKSMNEVQRKEALALIASKITVGVTEQIKTFAMALRA